MNLIRHTLLTLGLILISSTAISAGDPENGKQLAAACGACHGSDGNSISPDFPKIAGLGEKYLLKQLRDIQGKDPKTARPVALMNGLLDDLKDQELEDIAAYYASMSMQLAGAEHGTIKLNSGAEVDAIQYGEKVYRAGNAETGVPACSGCHSPTGKGNAPMGYPRIGGQYAAYIESQLLAFRSGERANDGEARIMRTVAKYMTEAEIKAVSTYISGLH